MKGPTWTCKCFGLEETCIISSHRPWAITSHLALPNNKGAGKGGGVLASLVGSNTLAILPVPLNFQFGSMLLVMNKADVG